MTDVPDTPPKQKATTSSIDLTNTDDTPSSTDVDPRKALVSAFNGYIREGEGLKAKQVAHALSELLKENDGKLDGNGYHILHMDPPHVVYYPTQPNVGDVRKAIQKKMKVGFGDIKMLQIHTPGKGFVQHFNVENKINNSFYGQLEHYPGFEELTYVQGYCEGPVAVTINEGIKFLKMPGAMSQYYYHLGFLAQMCQLETKALDLDEECEPLLETLQPLIGDKKINALVEDTNDNVQHLYFYVLNELCFKI